jgi:uncharacterized membrane protein YeiB
MTEPATADQPAPRLLAPVPPGERILALDVLRGIALFGVLTANIWLWFSGVIFRSRPTTPKSGASRPTASRSCSSPSSSAARP